MKTFDQDLKDELLAEIIKHREQDQIIQGTYGEGIGKEWKGCAVGCSIHSLNKIKRKRLYTDNHKVYETYLGIPEAIARLEDTIFEGLPVELAKEWPERFIKAVNVGADLSLVLPKFYIKILTDKKHGVRQYAFEDGKKAIDMVVKVHENHISTGIRDEGAAYSAAYSAAMSAKDSAWIAMSAESAARSAARSAASADSAASAHYEWMADVLIKILEESK